MFGNDGGHDDHDGFGLGQLLFGLWLWRELDSGRLDAGGVFKALFVIAAVLGGGFLLLLAIIGATMPRYDGAVDLDAPYPFTTDLPAYVPVTTPRPTRATVPTAMPSPAPTRKPPAIPGIGKRVAAGDGWTVKADKVQRWKPSWYHEPGWRLVTVHLVIGMPATDDGCAWGDMFSLTARSGREYQGWLDQTNREPELFACTDYHRTTTAKGWVTFEVRDKDAKGLVMSFCPDVLGFCEQPARIRIS